MNLPPQQRRCAELAAAGMPDKQIGRELGISYRTVKAHLRGAFVRLGVRSRTELAGRLA